MNKTLYMMVGLPASGKSTWIKQNKDKLNAVVISTDDIIEEMCAEHGLTYAEGFDRFVKAASNEMNRRVEDAIRNEQNVIWDQTNLTVKTRGRKLKQFSDYTKVAIFFDVDEAVIQQRYEQRFRETGKEIPYFVRKNMSDTFVAPCRSEGFDKIVRIR